MTERVTVHTIGHSNRSFEDFLDILHAHGITRLVDVRTVPKSRKWPHFAQVNLRPALEEAGVAYAHAPGLGGLRKPRKDSDVNAAWENAGFRGYADHLASPEFRDALDALLAAAAREPTTVMCAEAVPWRCHRRLIADAVTVRGHAAVHLFDARKRETHALTPFARVGPDGRLTYPDPQQRLDV